MKIYLLDPRSIVPQLSTYECACYDQIAIDATVDQHHMHQRVGNASDADCVLAAIQTVGFGPHFSLLRKSKFYAAYKANILCYSPCDLVYPALPGIYPSATAYWSSRGWSCGGHYISAHIRTHNFNRTDFEKRDLLFSFIGSSRTHLLREKVLSLKHPRCFLFDSNPKDNQINWWNRDPNIVEELYTQFKQTIQRTKFALCPRGVSPSSIRLFEAMEAACVPVIVADQLVLPQGPRWDDFCIRIPERNVGSIPLILEEMEPQSGPMGEKARLAWDQYFSPISTFNSLGNWSANLLQSPALRNRNLFRLRVRAGEYMLPNNVRIYGRHAFRDLKAKFTTFN